VRKDFDAELYLRLFHERALLESGQTHGRAPWDQPGIDVAATLVAVEALDADLAQQIVDDYAVAQGVRATGGGGQPMHRMAMVRTPPGRRLALTAPRVDATGWVLAPEWGTLEIHYVALGDRGVSLAVTAIESVPGALAQAQGRLGMPMTQATVTDDRGTTETAHFNGGGGSNGFSGVLVTRAPLARATAWIELGDQRIELGGPEPVATSRVEPLAPMAPAARLLWRRVGDFHHGRRHGPGTPVETTIETLVVAGELAPDDPLIGEVLEVAAALSGQPGAPGTTKEPWASILSAAFRADGPKGAVALGLVTDPVDGMVISLEGLVSTASAFSLRVGVSPGDAYAPLPFRVGVKSASLEWLGRDDLGNHYVGRLSGWGGSPDLSEGTIEFWPPLPKEATVVTLTATATTERAVVIVPLPPWDSRS
jgi:hypothetical protein